MLERGLVIAVVGFEFVFCHADVYFLVCLVGFRDHRRLVY